jgi:hypothetical protein
LRSFFALALHATLDVIQLGRDHAAGGALVGCVLVFTTVCAATVRAESFSRSLVHATAPLSRSASSLAAAIDDRARASPVLLQRFLR